MVRKDYTYISLTRCIFPDPLKAVLLLIPLLLVAFSLPVSGQEEYNEISVYTEIPQVGGIDIAAVINGSDLYLPVTDLFDFLKIRNIPDEGLNKITGFFINPEATYTISKADNQIIYQDKVTKLQPGEFIRTESNLFLKASYFGSVFGLDCIFNFRNLSVKIESKLELPLIREMRQEEMRKNLSRLRGEEKADTIIGRRYPMFKFGMADWAVTATEEVNGATDVRLNTALGAMVLGGEATANLNYSSQQKLDEKQQYYLWRYVNNDFSPLRQVMAGKIATHSISSIYNPVIGVQVTNTPTTFRRSFGTYTLSDRTEPNWIVELYVNNVLVDFVKADASGFFTFQVPLIYGNTIVRLKFFGPWGEERTREQNITIPFSFLPYKTLEYTASAGIVEDTLLSRFSRADFNYGLTKSITIGAGTEYLSSVTSGPAMPFVDASFRITNNLLLWGEYAYGVRTKGTLSYRLPSNMQLDLNYTWYDKNQTAINFNYREERKAALSTPLRLGKFYTFQRFTYYQIIMPFSSYTTGEWLFSGSVYNINTNITTGAIFIEKNNPYIYSNISMAFRLPKDFVVTPQVKYGYNKYGLISGRVQATRHMMEHGYMDLTYEHNFVSDMNVAEIGFRYDFSFAQTGISARQSDRKTSFVQYARGSIVNDSETKYLKAENRTNVGKGGITLSAFLDLNFNGKRDPGEQKVAGLNLRIGGGRVEKNERDSTIRILGLEPYTKYFLELDPNSFDNVAWRLSKRTMSVDVDPEIMKNIEIPVTVAGEVSGYVSMESDQEKKGIGRIVLAIYDNNQKVVAKVLTEDNGSYSYLGLKPGSYNARIDTAQLRKLDLNSQPDHIGFIIRPLADGDFLTDIDFTLTARSADTTSHPVLARQSARKDTTIMIIHELTQELVTIDKDSYAIQLGAFKERRNAENQRAKLEKLLGQNVDIVVEDGFYKVRIPDLSDRAAVDKDLALLKENGFTEVWVISLKSKKQQMVLRERKDTLTTISETEIPTGKEGVTIQLGAFRVKSNAMELLKHLKAKYGDRLKITFENGFYKLRLSGMSGVKKDVLDELNKNTKELGMVRFKDIWMSPPIVPSKEEESRPARPEIKVEKAGNLPPIPDLIEIKRPDRLAENKIVSPGFTPATNISIQVAAFDRKSDALKAQKKISSKLNLKAEIVEKWQRYYVIIRGFHTREETYQYYPELAGIGYPGISLIEE